MTRASPAHRLVRLSRDARLRAVVLALAAVAAVAARAPVVARYDFCTYYAAGSFARAGEPATAYDLDRLIARHQEFHPGPRGLGPFLYSPVWLAPASLFAAEEVLVADRLNRRLGAVCLFVGLACILLRLERARAQLGVAAVFALAHPSWVQLVYGNWTFVLFALVALAVWSGDRAGGWPAAAAWALALHLKLYVGVLLLALAVTERRREALRSGLLALVLAAATTPWLGVAPWRAFGDGLSAAAAAPPTAFYNQVSVAATVTRFHTGPREWLAPKPGARPPGTHGITLLGVLALAGGLVALRRAPDSALAFAIAWILLFVPLVWDHLEILLLVTIPALLPGHRLALGLALAASVAYQPSLQPLLEGSLRGETAPGAVRALLLFFPSINLLAFAAALAAGREEAARAGAAGGAGEP